MAYLAQLRLPGGNNIDAPKGIPQGGINEVQSIFSNSITIMIILTIILALFFLIWGGIQWITSGGDKNKVAQARAKLTWAIIGVVVAFVSFLIVNLIGYFFNIPIFGS